MKQPGDRMMSAKRKASAAALDSLEGIEDVKKRKIQDTQETPEGITEVGLQLLTTIKATRDKHKRLIATNFLTLPDKEQHPEYYKAIGLPIALDTIEGKLLRREYATVTPLESDLKRLISNAKSYNERNSDIFSNAEKLRKMLATHMNRINPAYHDGSGYTPFPTPIPEKDKEVVGDGHSKENENDIDADGETDPEETAEKLQPSVTPAVDDSIARRASSTPAVQENVDAEKGFDGLTFQEAQDKIVGELIQRKGSDGQSTSKPFLNLPSRELRHYYQVIKHPQCFKGLQKLVRGIKGREKPTGVSFFKGWQAFEYEASTIWNNARLYNEDGSEIFQLATEFEEFFQTRLAEAKKVIQEPPQPKVTLRLSARSPDPQPKIKLRVPSKSGGDSASGVIIDNDSLKRQQDLVKAGISGQSTADTQRSSPRPPSRNPSGGANSSTIPPPLDTDILSNSAISPPMTTNGVKHETSNGYSPALAAIQPRRPSNETDQSPRLAVVNMGPPATGNSSLHSGSPRPQALLSVKNTPYHPTPTNPLDVRWRQPGKGFTPHDVFFHARKLTCPDASDALIASLTVSTRRELEIPDQFHLDIPASATSTQQSVTINLPSTHYQLQIVPMVNPNVAHRPSKMFVTNNTTRLKPSNTTDMHRQVYDARLLPGVNRIEVELIAGLQRGSSKLLGSEIELEKITLFINILPAPLLA